MSPSFFFSSPSPSLALVVYGNVAMCVHGCFRAHAEHDLFPPSLRCVIRFRKAAGIEAGDTLRQVDEVRLGSLSYEDGVELLERRKGPVVLTAVRPNGEGSAAVVSEGRSPWYRRVLLDRASVDTPNDPQTFARPTPRVSLSPDHPSRLSSTLCTSAPLSSPIPAQRQHAGAVASGRWSIPGPFFVSLLASFLETFSGSFPEPCRNRAPFPGWFSSSRPENFGEIAALLPRSKASLRARQPCQAHRRAGGARRGGVVSGGGAGEAGGGARGTSPEGQVPRRGTRQADRGAGDARRECHVFGGGAREAGRFSISVVGGRRGGDGGGRGAGGALKVKKVNATYVADRDFGRCARTYQ